MLFIFRLLFFHPDPTRSFLSEELWGFVWKAYFSKKLKSVSIGSNITQIGEKAFKRCKKITYVNLASEDLTSIGKEAFAYCRKLKTVVISSVKLETIGKKCFYKCKNLSDMRIESAKLEKSSVGKNAFKGMKRDCRFEVPETKISDYQIIFKDKGARKSFTVKKLS